MGSDFILDRIKNRATNRAGLLLQIVIHVLHVVVFCQHVQQFVHLLLQGWVDGGVGGGQHGDVSLHEGVFAFQGFADCREIFWCGDDFEDTKISWYIIVNLKT